MNNKTIVLFHPFSAKAIGLFEVDLYHSHSKPHFLAMCLLSQDEYRTEIHYFTNRFFSYSKKVNHILKRFFVVTKPFFYSKKRWRKEHSKFHYNYCKNNFADVTIINMSGHLSDYTLKFARLLSVNNKAYIAMVGGVNMSFDEKAFEYYANANHIIVHTKIQKEKILQQKKFDKLTIKVVPLGIDTELFKPSKFKETQSIKLLYVGRISRLKQIEKAIETAIFINKQERIHVSLDIIGPKKDIDYYHSLLNIIEKNDAGSYINFLGSITNNDLVKHYQKSSLLLLPSAHESFGIVIVEAMACGTPTVAILNSGGPDEIIRNNYNGILSKKEDYINDIAKLLNDKERLTCLSNNCRIEALNKYSIINTKNKLKQSIDLVFGKNENI